MSKITHRSALWRKGTISFLSSLLFVTGFSAKAQDYQWANSFGSIFQDAGYSTATDATGSVYVAGHFYGTLDFDPGVGTANLTSNGGIDIFLAKYDATGAYLWAINMGGTSTEYVQSVTVDASGNAIVTGMFYGTADFDPGIGTVNLTTNGNADIFLAKYDANGTYMWATSIGGTSNDEGYSVAVDASGNALVTGRFNGTVDFNPGSGTSNLSTSGSYNVFLAKYDASGVYQWAIQMGGTSNDYGIDVTVDASGNALVTGQFYNTVDFDPGAGTANLTSNGSSDIFLAKYDDMGTYMWAINMGNGNGEYSRAVAMDASGNVLVTGYFQGTVDYNPGVGTANLSSNGAADIFLAKYDASGTYMWAINIGGASNDISASIAVDSSDNILMTGFFHGTADFDPGVSTANRISNGAADIFLAKYDATGTYMWATSIGGTNADLSYSLALDGSGNVLVTGYFSSTADFNPGIVTNNFTSNGGSDIFIAKYLDTTFVNIAPQTSFYVNDNSASGDVYTTAVGNDANNGTPSTPYLTIQAAVDAANDGDTVYVDAGYYNENVSINKELTLLGAGKTLSTIDGDNAASGSGAIFLPSGGSNIQIGAMGQGFHVIGLDGPSGIEKAAIYLQGAQTNITIIDNEIEARGDAALMGEYNAANDNVVIDNNHFTGQTFNGANPAGVGFSAQFSLPNVPRQAVVFGGGSSTTNTQNFTFTNNEVSTVTGGQSITDNSGNPIAPTDQGNMMVTLDVIGTNLIQGNTFNGTTVSYRAALRTRGTGYTIDYNIFDGNYFVGMSTAANAVTATNNYWGDASGPYHAINNPCGLGKAVPNNVTFAPFYTDASLTTTSSSSAPSVTNISQNTSHCSIQAAVDAANATDTIVASAGTFTEQVEISKDLVLMGQGMGATIIKGAANMPLYFTTSANNYPIVYVHDAADVIIKDLTVDGDGKGNSNYRYQGIAYSNAAGTIDGVEVTSVIETPFNGNQHGIGIFADASAGTARTLTVINSIVTDCQKNTLSLSGADLTGIITDNQFIGAGAIGTPLPAQNGIQFYGTAGGEIKNNIVKGFWYTPNTWTATGMLLYSNLGSIEVDGNDLDSNDAHIYAYNGNATITNNDMKDGNYGVIAYSYGTNMSATIANNAIMDVETGVGVYEGNGTAATATVNENSLTGITGFAIENGTAATVDATCNWYGTADDATIQALLDGPVNYSPFLNNGTDNDVAQGFQPVPGSCPSTQPDSLVIVSDASWMQSTFTNTTEANGFPWQGVSSLPDVSTFTIPAELGQPKPWHTIDSVDGARVIKSGNAVTFFRTTFDLALDTGVSAQIMSRMDDGMEIYINGKLIAREGDYTTENWDGLPHNLVLSQNGEQDNGHNGDLPFDLVNNYRLDSVVTTGENELIIVLRNTLKSYDIGAFTFRMDLKTGEAYIPVLTDHLVSDVEWEKSTSTTAGGSHYIWDGSHSLPAAATYTEDAELGQPYGWYSTEEVPGSFAIKTGSDITYHRRRFNLIDSADVNVRLRTTFDEGVMIYINDVLIASDYTSDVANREIAAHDVMFVSGGATTNGNAGGDMFEQVENVDFNNILRKGDNYITVVLRNKVNTDKGGFSLRVDMDQAGNPVIRKSARSGNGSGNAEENELNVRFDIYPNPTNGKVYIDLTESPSADNTVTVLDLNGKIMLTRTLLNPQTGMMDIDLSDFANGMYIIRVNSGDKEFHSKRVMKF